MYCIYQRILDERLHRFIYSERTALYGCRSGVIPKLMMMDAKADQSETYKWHVNVPDALERYGKPDNSIIIDLKPKQKSNNLSLYELLDVWGYSSGGWTPIMMRMRGLFIDFDPTKVDRNNFVYDLQQADDPIFSVSYLAGSIKDGALVGKWTTPGPSSTNGVLMWPCVMEYFCSEAKKIIPKK